MTSKQLPTSVWIAFITLCLVWGTTYLGVKNAVHYFSPFWFSGFRNFSAGFILLAFCLVRGYKLPSWTGIKQLTIIAIFMITGGNALLAWAMQYISSGLGSILSATAPLFITFLSLFFFKGFRVTWAIVGGLFLSIIGIALLSKPDTAYDMKSGFIGGVLLTFTANLAWAFGAIFMRKFTIDAHVFMRTALQMLIGGAINFGIAAIFEPPIDLKSIPTEGWLWSGYLIGIGSIIGYICFVYLLDNISPARLSIHTYVNTIVAVIVGWLFAHEHLNWLMVGAMFVVLVGVLIVNNAYAKMAQLAFQKE